MEPSYIEGIASYYSLDDIWNEAPWVKKKTLRGVNVG